MSKSMFKMNMSLLLSTILYAIFWNYIRTYIVIKPNQSKKITANKVSFLHAVGILIISLLCFFSFLTINNCYKLILYWSGGYYLMDTFRKLCYIMIANNIFSYNSIDPKEINIKIEIMYIVHHIFTMLIILKCGNKYDTKLPFIIGFGIMEISNMPLFIVYHMKHLKYNNLYITIATIIETIIYTFVRVVLGCVMLIYAYHVSSEIYYVFCVIYIMSVIWSGILIKQSCNLFKKPKQS